MFWFVAGIMAVAALGFAALPLFWRPSFGRGAATGGAPAVARRSYDIAIYADQLKALESELERGEISAAQAQTARTEIERRILKAADQAEPALKPELSSRNRWILVAVIALIVPAFGFGLYLKLGSPELPDHPYIQGEGAEPPAEHAKNMALVEKLVAYMKLHPDKTEGWLYLRQAMAALGDNPRAARLLQDAVAARPGDVDLRVMLGESFVAMADGQVTPAAKLAFEQAQQLAPNHPGPRFYLALANFQKGDYEAAYNGWKALEVESPPDAPWLDQVRARLRETALKLGRAPEPEAPAANTAAPTPEQKAAVEAMSPAEREAMIRGMVQKLDDRMQTRPRDYDGWMRLGRAYAVLGNKAKALDAYGKAQKFAPPEIQKAIAAEMASLAGPGK